LIINGIEFAEPDFVCRYCGCKKLKYEYKDKNNAIKASCHNCGRYFKFVKHDKRSQEAIRKEAIENWKEKRNQNSL